MHKRRRAAATPRSTQVQVRRPRQPPDTDWGANHATVTLYRRR